MKGLVGLYGVLTKEKDIDIIAPIIPSLTTSCTAGRWFDMICFLFTTATC